MTTQILIADSSSLTVVGAETLRKARAMLRRRGRRQGDRRTHLSGANGQRALSALSAPPPQRHHPTDRERGEGRTAFTCATSALPAISILSTSVWPL